MTPSPSNWGQLTPSVFGQYRLAATRYPDLRILGLVCSEIVIGTDIISKLFAEVVNFVGGSSGNYQAYIEQARHQVTQDIIDKALNAKADAIMGIKYDYENIGNGMLMVGVTGTAIKIKEGE